MWNSQSIYDGLVRRTPGLDRAEGLTADAGRDVAGNGLRQVLANTLQAIGDQVVNPKTVLPWLLTMLSAPTAFVGLLVPIRESGSMLPQAALLPIVRRRARRSPLWIAGSIGQATATACLALTAALLSGALAGLAIVVFLSLFSLSRGLNSLVSKDVLGRTVPQGQRGQINGLAMAASGAVAIVIGLGVRSLDHDASGVLAAMLVASAAMWLLAAIVYAGIREPVDDNAPDQVDDWWKDTIDLFRDDRVFRRFVTVRGLLLVSALSPPFVVSLAARSDQDLGGLGLFIVASGLASLIGGRAFGRLADRSSRNLLTIGSGTATAILILFLLLLQLSGSNIPTVIYPLVYLALVLIHTGVRVARKTYIVDVAEGDRRTQYVAVSNTVIGALLLIVGAISGALALLGAQVALVFLAILGLAGMALSSTLPEVSAGQ